MKKALVFDDHVFNQERLLQIIKYIFNDPTAEFVHVTHREAFEQMLALLVPFHLVVVDFQMSIFDDWKEADYEAFIKTARRIQKSEFAFVGMTGDTHQARILEQLGVGVRSKEYSGKAFRDLFGKSGVTQKAINISAIQEIVCEHFNVESQKLFEKTRKREIVQARQTTMYLAKMYTRDSLKTIGEFFGGRDHTTVIHSCQTVMDLMDTDVQYAGNIMILRETIVASFPFLD